MQGRPVELRIAGQTCRVVSTATEAELERLADLVTARVEALTAPGRSPNPQALLLAAVALAHDLEQERAARLELEQRAGTMLRHVLRRLDAALEATDEPGPTASRFT